MLVKYYGLVKDDKYPNTPEAPRISFLSDGLFRATQPKFLNDQSEGKFYPYFNEFSPADHEWARKQHNLMSYGIPYPISQEELENFYLRPTGLRTGDLSPQILKANTGFESMHAYDISQFDKIVDKFNSLIIELLSSQLGVISLSKSDRNKLMWTYYASEGKGVAVTFNKDHTFFSRFPAVDVSYKLEDRACITYFNGVIRINGFPAKSFTNINMSNPMDVFQAAVSDGIDMDKLARCLIAAKTEEWERENEARLIIPTSYCEEFRGNIVSPLLGEIKHPTLEQAFPPYKAVSLKKIPFEAFESLILGYNISSEHKELVINQIKSNANLAHIKVKQARHNNFGDIETFEI